MRERRIYGTGVFESPVPVTYFGGKSKIASNVWKALGDVGHYIEPFFGSGAVLLARENYDSRTNTETICDKDGFVCLAPETQILKADLQWGIIGKCEIGDKLLAFDEFNTAPRFKKNVPSGYRHWRIATVTAKKIVQKPCYRLRFSDGTVIVCSEEHQWLGGKNRGLRWLTTKNWKTTIVRKNQKAWVLKILPVIKQQTTYESGWLGGFADGEGHYHGSAAGGGGSWAISLHQAEGKIIEYAQKLLTQEKYKIRIENRQKNQYKPMVSVHINGGMAETFRFLMSFRPERLISNLIKGIEKKSIFTRHKQYVSVESMEYVGLRNVIALETDTHTFIAEGLASHNCNVWRSLQFNPDEVAKWCDWPVNHADLSARKKELIKNEERLLENLIDNPEWYDAKLAGYWIWAASCWIGSGLTMIGQIPKIAKRGSGVHGIGQMPHISHSGMGIHSTNHKFIYENFKNLSNRLRYVRVVCGDWTRVCGGNWQDKIGIVGIFFDPPYGVMNRDTNLYHHDSINISKDVESWCLERGKLKSYRIVVAGYEEYPKLIDAGWKTETWSTQGGYSNTNKDSVNNNRHRETLYYSPNCVQRQKSLFK